MKTKLIIAVWLPLAMLSFAYLGYRAGRTQEAMKWSWVPKEHLLLLGSMERIEILLSNGETGAVIRAVGAYNQTAKAATNEFDFYRAAHDLFDATK